MCAPLAIAAVGLAVSAAGTAAAYESQSQNADAQAGYENQLYTSTVKAATGNYQQQLGQEQVRIGEVEDSAKQQSLANTIQGVQGEGQVRAVASARGVEGHSVNDLVQDFQRVTQANNQTLATNLAMQRQQSFQNELSFKSEAQSRIAGATPAPVPVPSALAAALQLGSTGLQAYDSYSHATQTGPYDPKNFQSGQSSGSLIPRISSNG